MRRDVRRIIVLLALLLVTGCLGGAGRPQEREAGKMHVSAIIPEVLRTQKVSSQSVLEDVTLQTIVVTVTRGASTERQQVEVSATTSTVEASFANLSPGTWHVQVQAVDDEDYVIADGTGSAIVSPGAVTDEVVNLQVKPGTLTLHLMVPDATSVTSGRISLLVGGAEEEFPATGNETTTVEMGQVMAQVWLIEVELHNASGGWVFRGHGQVAVLPGRDTNATIVFDEQAPGGLRVTVSWNLPPEKPTNVQASYAGGAVRVSWDAVDGAVGYMIIRSVTADGHGVVLTDGLITGMSYVDDHAFAEGTTYWYRVLAYDSDYVSSSFSDAVSVTVSQLQTTIAVAGDHSIMVHVAQITSSVSTVEAVADEHSLAVPVEEWQILLLETDDSTVLPIYLGSSDLDEVFIDSSAIAMGLVMLNPIIGFLERTSETRDAFRSEVLVSDGFVDLVSHIDNILDHEGLGGVDPDHNSEVFAAAMELGFSIMESLQSDHAHAMIAPSPPSVTNVVNSTVSVSNSMYTFWGVEYACQEGHRVAALLPGRDKWLTRVGWGAQTTEPVVTEIRLDPQTYHYAFYKGFNVSEELAWLDIGRGLGLATYANTLRGVLLLLDVFTPIPGSILSYEGISELVVGFSYVVSLDEGFGSEVSSAVDWFALMLYFGEEVLVKQFDAVTDWMWQQGYGLDPVFRQKLGRLLGNVFQSLRLVSGANVVVPFFKDLAWPLFMVDGGLVHLEPHSDPSFAGGSGTVEDPYLIGTAQQLDAMRLHLEEHFQLVAELDLIDYGQGMGWEPIGHAAEPFRGSFDGNGHTIANLTINRPESDFVGLFGVTDTAEFRNVELVGVDVTGWQYVGSLVGAMTLGEMIDCHASGIVYGAGGDVGGLIGASTANVVSDSSAAIDASGGGYVGGLVGRQGGPHGGLVRCWAAGDITGTVHLGGLVGWLQEGYIDQSFSRGSVLGREAGGLVGRMVVGSVSDSYASGDVHGEERAGGLVGRRVYIGFAGPTIQRSYAVGSVTGVGLVGGLVAGGTEHRMEYCYFDRQTSGQSDSNGEPKSTHEMRQESTFVTWDFDDVWAIQEGLDYPHLRWE